MNADDKLDGSIFILRLQSRRGDEIRRSRSLLKILLRRFELRCLSIEEARRS